MFAQSGQKEPVEAFLSPHSGGGNTLGSSRYRTARHVSSIVRGVNSRVAQHASTRANARYRTDRTPAERKKRAIKIVLLALLAVVVWFGIRAAVVAFNLYSVQSLAKELQSEFTAGDLEAIADTTGTLKLHTVSAAAGTADPTWRLAELVPALGPNLHSVRMLAESANDIVVNVASPGIDIAASFDLSERDSGTGGFDLAPIAEARTVAAKAAPVVNDSIERLDSVDRTATASVLVDATDEISRLLRDAAPIANSAEPIVDLAGAVLGDKGPRNYLLAFQNNAESTALGGSAASYTMLHTDGGVITTAKQANSGDFHQGTPDGVTVDQSALDVFGPFLTRMMNTSTSRPDGVISVDPLALALILEATGPIDLTSGDVLTSENAVDLLTNGVYLRYPTYEDAPMADAFFTEAASSIMDRVTSGSFEIPKMVSAVTKGIAQGSVMMWSANADEQAALNGFKIQGVLPTSNTESTTMGVYYRDTSASKIDYYLNTASSTSSDVCTNQVNPSFTTQVTLTSNLTREQAQGLPDYVKSFTWGAAKFRTEVFVYGPVGASVTSGTVVSEGLETLYIGENSDLGRPVASFAAYLAPGESTTVSATFQGTEGAYGPLEIRGTPMINATDSSIEASACG
jgi:predicted RecA/RadA family phage recombinase